jgi:hypothetical protein
MLGLDLDSWNGVLVVSLFLAALAAVVVGVATFAVIRLQRAEEIATKEEFERYKIEAGERISDTYARAAEANQKAEQEKLARVKIEERLADRQLSDSQVAAIAEKIKPFGAQEFAMVAYWNLREPMALAERVFKVFQLTDWKYIPPPATGIMLIDGIEGVQIWLHPDADPRTWEAAIALEDALKTEGITAELKTQNPANPKDNRITLNVGTKP